MKLKQYILILSALFFTQLSFGQNIEFEKKLDNDFELFAYTGAQQNYTRYYKVFENKILRIENLKIQLFDEEFEKLWEIKLALVENKKQNRDAANRVYLTTSDDNIYLCQTSHFSYGSDLLKTKVIKITENGEKSEVELSKDYDIWEFGNIEVIDNNLFIHLTIGIKDAMYLSYYSEILAFDSNLNSISTYRLPKIESNEGNPNVKTLWKYEETKSDGSFSYKAFYYKKNNGKFETYFDYKAFFLERMLNISKDNKVISDEIKNHGNKQKIHSGAIHYRRRKFDKTKYRFIIDGKELVDLRYLNSAVKAFDSISVLKDDGELIKIIFQEQYKKWFNKQGGKRLADIIEDPINGGINIILHGGAGLLNMITLNKDYTISKVQIFEAWPWRERSYRFNQNFAFVFGEVKKSIGEFHEDYKRNAFDYALTLENDQFITIVNYSDYQLLFTDNKETKETKVYKIIR